MWFTLALFVVSFLASAFLAPKPELENARAAKLSDMKFPLANAGSPVPVIFGRVRLRSPNCIWYGDFKTRARKKKVKTGIFSSERVIVGYNYLVGFDLALCTGPGVKLRKIWCEKKVLYSSGVGIGPGPAYIIINKPGIFGENGGGFYGDVYFYGGENSQIADSYLITKLGSDIPGYSGIAHIVFRHPYIGKNPQLRPLSFEIERYSDNLGLSSYGHQKIGDDLNPMEVLYSLLTENWGCLGVDPSNINIPSLISAAETLYNEDNGMSIIISSPNTAKDTIQEILRQVDGILYAEAETGKISVCLIRKDYVKADLPLFDETNVAKVSNFSRSSWGGTYNQVRATFNCRNRKYETEATIVQDVSNINMQNQIKSTTISLPGCTEGLLATEIATRELSQLSVPLFKTTLDITRAAIGLHPGSPIRWSWPNYRLSEEVMRIQRFNLGELANGQIVVEVIQDKFAAANQLFTSPEDTLWDEIDRTAIPIVDYTVFESPYWFVQKIENLEIPSDSSWLWAFVRRPDKMQLFDLVVSNDNFILDITIEVNHQEFMPSTQLVGDLYKNMGQSDGVIEKITIDNPDFNLDLYGFTLSLDQVLKDSSATGIRDNGDNLIVIDNEILAYETYTDLGNNIFELNNVHRALLDTQFEDHTNNTIVYIIGDINCLSKNARADTDVLKYKLLSYSDQDGEDIDDVSAVGITMNQRYDRPLPSDQIEVDSIRCPIEIVGVNNVDVTSWLERNRITPDQIVLVPDSTDTPEVGTTYNIYFKLGGVVKSQQLGVVLASAPINLSGLSGADIGSVEIESIKGGLASWSRDCVEFYFAYYQNLSSDLLVNGDFEITSLSSWLKGIGNWDGETTEYPLDAIPTGVSHVQSLDYPSSVLYQEVDIISPDYRGKTAVVRAFKGGLNDSTLSQLKVELKYNTTIIDTITSNLEVPDDIGKWGLIEIPLSLSTNINKVRVTLIASGLDSVWDNVSLKANTLSTTNATQYNSIGGLTVKGAWGLRQMVSTYSGPLVKIRDTYDDSEFDIEQDYDGNLESFYVKGEARVVILYDQSGNGANLEAENATEQPRLRWMLSETGRPHIEFTSDVESLLDTIISTSRPYMVTRPNCSLVIGPRQTEQNCYIATIPHTDGSHVSPYLRWGMAAVANDWYYMFNSAARIDAGNGDPDVGKNVWFADAYNGATYHNDDATAVDTFTPADTTYPNATRLRIAETGGETLDWDGEFYELCIFEGNISAADRKTLMESVANYWFNLSV